MRPIAVYQKQHALYAKRIRPLFLKALQKQVQPAIDWILETGVNPDLDIIIAPGIFVEPMKQAYGMVGSTAARREYYYQRGEDQKGLLDFLMDKWREIFRSYATNYAYRIDNELTETTKQAIRDAIRKADEEGMNADRKATLIKRSVQGQLSRSRATLIAVTEATTASNLGKMTGAQEYFQETNQQGYKQWLGRNDGRERHSHVAKNDDIIPMADMWTLTDDKGVVSMGMAPGDVSLPANERCRCRCSQLFMTERRYLRYIAGNN